MNTVWDKKYIQNDLLNLSADAFITKWFFDTTPRLFENKEMEFILWRDSIAEELKIDPSDIIITGSAGIGYSLNPNKGFKEFDDSSDIDVCIVSQHYFNIAWHELINVSPDRLGDTRMRTALNDHRQRLIYWGTIATDKILPLLSFAKSWNDIINASKKLPELEAHDINFRIYKDKLAIRRYLKISVEKAKTVLLEGKVNERLSSNDNT